MATWKTMGGCSTQSVGQLRPNLISKQSNETACRLTIPA